VPGTFFKNEKKPGNQPCLDLVFAATCQSVNTLRTHGFAPPDYSEFAFHNHPIVIKDYAAIRLADNAVLIK
jgi:hypothetical protein